MAKPRCADNPIQPEFTLCGRAFDDVEDDQEAPLFVMPGHVVTCEQCLAVIRHCRRFTGNRQPLAERT